MVEYFAMQSCVTTGNDSPRPGVGGRREWAPPVEVVGDPMGIEKRERYPQPATAAETPDRLVDTDASE
jgi:hypothetical protein